MNIALTGGKPSDTALKLYRILSSSMGHTPGKSRGNQGESDGFRGEILPQVDRRSPPRTKISNWENMIVEWEAVSLFEQKAP